MRFFEEKEYPRVQLHVWFAWYPIWVWDSMEHNKLTYVWLENVWRKNGYHKKWKYYLLSK